MDLAFARNRPKFIPEDVFEADASLPMADHNRPFYDSGFAAGVVEVVVSRFGRSVIMTMGRHGTPQRCFRLTRISYGGIFTRATRIASLD